VADGLADIRMSLSAPFPYFGGKSRASELVWSLIGDTPNYVEPFCGSLAMLLNRPNGAGHVETVNDACGFIANFWRAVKSDPELTAQHADWPVNEIDLESRHGWLINRSAKLREWLADPDYFDAKIAGWWCWGACNWIGSGWCEGRGPWRSDGASIVDSRKLPHLGDAGRGINRKLPHLSAGQGINRKLPHLSAGQGINKKLPHLSAGRGINRQLPHLSAAGRGDFIRQWFNDLSDRIRDVRVACGDWSRVVTNSVTTQHGMTGVFLDPPYTEGRMEYAAGGCGGDLASTVADWCKANGDDQKMRIVLCGHAGEHGGLSDCGWTEHQWKGRKGYAVAQDAVERSKSETVWASPNCLIANPMLAAI